MRRSGSVLAFCLTAMAIVTLTAHVTMAEDAVVEIKRPLDFDPLRFKSHILVIDGRIDRGLRDSILALDPENIRVVVLRSEGGSVRDAIAIGNWIRENEIRTHVPAGSYCYSSCTVLFQSGVVRSAHASAHFAYHYATQESADPRDRTMGRVLGTVMYLEALISFGAPESLYRLVPGRGDWEISADQARRYRIAHAVVRDEAGLSEN